MQANPNRQLWGYTPDCPYFQQQSPTTSCSFLPMCRLKETFEDGRIFTADSFGDRDWIDVTEARPCGHGCLCNDPGVAIEERAFSFTVEKTPTKIKFLFHDLSLRDVVMEALAHKSPESVSGDTPECGFILLRDRLLLAKKLWQMQQDLTADPRFNFGVANLSLLVNGVLDDPQVFSSYDFSWFHNEGYLKAADWDWFHGYSSSRGRRTKFRRRRLSMSAAERFDKSTARVFATLAYEPSEKNYYENLSSLYLGRSEPPPFTHEGRSETGGWWEDHAPHESIPTADSSSQTLSIVSTKADAPSGRYDSETRFPRLQPRLLGPKTDVDRNMELWNAISGQDIVRVQNILQREALKCGETDLGSHRQARQAQDSTQIDAQMLLLAVQMDCTRSTKLLLSHRYDVNCQFEGETPLTSAAVSGSNSLVRLLLHYGAEVSVAALILQSRDDRVSIRRIDSLARPYGLHIPQEKFKCNGNLIQLRKNFWKEHALMSKAATDGPFAQTPKPIPRTAPWQPDSHMQPFPIEKNVRLAWSTSVATMRGLCNGKLPGDAREALLFIALVKSMAPIVGGRGGQNLEDEFFADISRWQLVFRQDVERRRFEMAVKTIWDIDVTQSRLETQEGRSGFEREILHIQDLTNRLVNQAHRAFRFTDVIEMELPNVQARWQARQTTSERRHPEELAHHRIQDNASFPLANDSLPPVGIEEANLSGPLEEGLISETLQKSESPFTPDTILVTVLAGSIFAIILAFFLLLRNWDHRHVIKILFPLPITVFRDENCGIAKYDQTRMANRTRVLLEFYLDGITPMAYGYGIPNSQRRSGQQSADLAHPTSCNDMGQLLPPEPASVPRESVPAPKTDSTEFENPTPTQVERKCCDMCNRDFSTSGSLGRHKKEQHESVRYRCRFPSCGKSYKRNCRRELHEVNDH